MKVSSKRVSGKVLAMWCSGSLRKNPDKSTGSASDNFHQFPIYTSSTAQGGGGSFRIGNLWETLVVVNHGWQSESTD